MRFLLNLAVLPGVLIMIYVYKKDKIESEPIKLLLKLFLFGVLSTIPAMIFETIGDAIVYGDYDETEASLFAIAIENFLVVALSEEFFKFLLLKLGSWKNKAFDFRFDAIVYAVTTGMGFAIFENILYVLDGGIETALIRAVISIPGHASFAICMGIYYGQAKYCEYRGDKKGCQNNLMKAVIMPLLMHGFFDFCLSVDDGSILSGMLTAIFYIYIAIVDIVSFKRIKKYSEEDRRLNPYATPGTILNTDGEPTQV